MYAFLFSLTKIKNSVIAIFLDLAHSFKEIQLKLECKSTALEGRVHFCCAVAMKKFVLWQYVIIKDDFNLKGGL